MTATTNFTDQAFRVHAKVRALGDTATATLLDAICEDDPDTARTLVEGAATLVFRMRHEVEVAEEEGVPGIESARTTVEKFEANIKKVHAKIEG